MPRTICFIAGCGRTSMEGSTYCSEAHAAKGEAARAVRQAERDKERGPANERGYDRRWRKVREHVLREYPLCHDCQAEGRAVVATEVHHRQKIADAPDLRLDRDNLMPLCHDCHAARTARGE